MSKKAKKVKKAKKKKSTTKKKSTAKKAKRKQSTLPANISLTQEELRLIALDRKRLQVKALLPEIECTGREKCGDEIIPFTEAEIVREKFFAVFESIGLTICPIAGPGMMPQIAFQGRMFAVVGCYRITDIDTGYSVISWGVGIGINGDWAANTAQTRAMKQFLLGSFETNWKDPTKSNYVPLPLISPAEAVEAMKQYFDQSQKKGAKRK